MTWQPETDELKRREHLAEWAGRRRFFMGIWSKDENKGVGQIWIEPDKPDVPWYDVASSHTGVQTWADHPECRPGWTLEAQC